MPKWLGLKPVVTGGETCNLALLELAELNAREAAINSELDVAVRALRVASDKQRVTRGETFAERRQRLEEAIRRWAAEHPPEASRTRALEGGEIRHQAQRVTLETVNDNLFQQALGTATEAVKQALNCLHFRRVPLGEVFDVRVTLGVSKTLEGVAAKTITDRNLQAIGLKRWQPPDRILIKPAEHGLVAQ